MSAEEQGPTARNLYGPVQLSEGLASRTLTSVSVLAPWRMVAAVLYTHAQTPTVKLETGCSASEKAEFQRSTQKTVRAWCSRTISYARC